MVITELVCLDLPRSSMTAQPHEFRYHIDSTDRLVWVDEWWLAFATENGASEIVVDSILGRPLWDFISGEGTRKLYEEIHARVRRHGNPVVVPFRCDSPTLQRHMRLRVTAGEEGRLVYRSVLLRVEPQPYLAVIDPKGCRSDCLLTMCSCCKRALLEPVGWLDLEDASTKLRLFDTTEVPNLRYEICPECDESINGNSDNNNAA